MSNASYPATEGRGAINWQGKKILIVEDEPANREYLKILLTRTNAMLVYAENGLQVRLLLKELNNIDLVLLDIRLPDASGWDLAREIKAIRSDLPVIAQTAFAMTSDRLKCEEAGCDGFISKPINKTALMNMISDFLPPENQKVS